jgi:hypothetical protein
MNRQIAGLFLLIAALAPSTAPAAPVAFDTLVIEGEVQKPELALLITRENLAKAYDLEPLEASFVPRIAEALERAPF